MKKLLFFIFNIFLILSLASCSTSGDLDLITSYKITIEPDENGNLDMHYEINWKVLDDSSGALEWVKIGIPNKYIENLSKNSSSISDIYYYSDNGAYVRLDLDRSYYEGEELLLDFSFKQTHIYSLSDNTVEYGFMPGWFDEIKVEKLQVYWKYDEDNITYYNTDSDLNVKIEEGYIIYETSLDYGSTIYVNVKYKAQSFTNLSDDNTYSSDFEDNVDDIISLIVFLIILTIVLIIIIVICVINYKTNDGYLTHRGFIKNHHTSFYYYFFKPSRGVNHKGRTIGDPRVKGGHNGSGSHFSCACACACAGGGRAGCSRKDFYNPKLKINQLNDVIKNENNKK